MDGEWSAAIPGTGGSAFVTEEKSGLHTNDECYKMALTDAISVACKSLGFGANVYWEKDSESKYTKPTKSDNPLKGNDHLALEEKKLKPMDVFDLPGAANVDNKTLFVNALQIAQLTNEQGAEILNGMLQQQAGGSGSRDPRLRQRGAGADGGKRGGRIRVLRTGPDAGDSHGQGGFQ